MAGLNYGNSYKRKQGIEKAGIFPNPTNGKFFVRVPYYCGKMKGFKTLCQRDTFEEAEIEFNNYMKDFK